MILADVIALSGMQGAAAGTQSEPPDSKGADKWIKDWMDRRQGVLNEMRQRLARTYDPPRSDKEREVDAAVYQGKPAPLSQNPMKTSEGGRFAVVDPAGIFLSTHHDFEEAQTAAIAKRYAKVVDLGADKEFRKKYLVKRSGYLEEVDKLRSGEKVPSKEYWRRTTGGTGGSAGPAYGTGDYGI
jgi:hypothetical protein